MLIEHPAGHVPHDDFTPHGYLDIPTHSRRLSPRGVVRSHDLGFRFHYPAYASPYGGRSETYRAGFRLAVNGTIALDDFDYVSSDLHTKNIMQFTARFADVTVTSEWMLIGSDVLITTVSADHTGAEARIAVLLEYTRRLSANGEWGESGLVARTIDDRIVIQGFEDGEAFVLWSSVPWATIGLTSDPSQAQGWVATGSQHLPVNGSAIVLGAAGDSVAAFAVAGLDLSPATSAQIFLARGRALDDAQRHLDDARRDWARERAVTVANDERFWATAPRLSGDWPDHWRRGLIYDLETLRMMVKAPIGIYHHAWDAMQIQAPRVVLGEAAIDAHLLAFADPALAQAMLLGTFLDAPAPNVPCTREDGTYNMVAADGTVCGTGPQWGYPWLVLDWLWKLRPDKPWLAELYPRLVEYLNWWIVHRRTDDGWMFFACSWESGQDLSSRFGPQPLGGGHPVRHIHPVDLHAAMAHAASVMERFADQLGNKFDVQKWHTLREDLTHRMNQLWHGNRFADRDGATELHTERSGDVSDLMLFSPIALGLADDTQRQMSRDALSRVSNDELTWPVFVWTVVEAAYEAGLHDHAAAYASAVCDRAWRFWDKRRTAPSQTLPGIACEYWPLNGRCGGEGYGWGAFGVHLLLHSLVGFTPEVDGFTLRPNFPPALRVPGKSYTVGLHVRDTPITITIEPRAADSALVTVNGDEHDIPWGHCIHLAL